MAGGIRVSADEYAAVEAAVRQAETYAGVDESEEEPEDDFDLPEDDDEGEDPEDDESEEDDEAEEPESSRSPKRKAATPAPSKSGVLHADRMERYLRQFLEEGNKDALTKLQADKVGSKLLASVNKALDQQRKEQSQVTAKGMSWYYRQLEEQSQDFGEWQRKARANPQIAARFAEYAKFTEDVSSGAIELARPKPQNTALSALVKHHDRLLERYDGKLSDEELEAVDPDLYAEMDVADAIVAMSEAAEKLWKKKQKNRIAKPLRQREAALSAPARAAAAAARTAPPARIPQGKGSQTIDKNRFLAAWRENPTDPRLNRIYREHFSGGR